MKKINILRMISITAYLFIILAGDMIGVPFICWLLFTIFDFGNIDQFFAILGIIGVLFTCTKWVYKTPVAILCFLLMLSPIISRMVQVPLGMFNYLAFKIPVFIFIICYVIFMIFNARKEKS